MADPMNLSFLKRGQRSTEVKCRTVAMYLYGPYTLEQAADVAMVKQSTVREWINEY